MSFQQMVLRQLDIQTAKEGSPTPAHLTPHRKTFVTLD